MRARGPAGRGTPARLSWLLGGLVAGWTLVAFLPTVWNGFVNWDDQRMFLENPSHRGPAMAELWYAWSSHLLGEYMPMTWMSYTLDRVVWDLHAPGYHLTNLLLHVLAALAVFALARRLLRQALGPDAPGGHAIDMGATATALVFAVHPLRVEPVAWVSARGTVLGGLLVILAVLAYVMGWERGARSGRVTPAWLAGSLVLFMASLLARATGVTLPAVLLILDVYPLGRIGGAAGWWGPKVHRVWMEKAAFVAASALATPMAFLARGQKAGDFTIAGWHPLGALASATYSIGFYVWKTVGVGTLSPMYPMPMRDGPMLGHVLLSGITAVVITVTLVVTRRRWPGALAAWTVYLVLLAPMSGVLPFGLLRGVVDRYTYAACIGWALVAGGVVVGGWRAWDQRPSSRFSIGLKAVALTTVLLGWSALSWRQAGVWHDGVTLWTRAVAVMPHSATARTNLGQAFADRGDFAAAAVQYREAARVLPTAPGPLQNLGRVLAAEARYAEAEGPFRQVVKLQSDSAEAHLDLGTALYNLGRVNEAVLSFTRAVELDPGLAQAHEYLGTALWRLGRKTEAAHHLDKAILESTGGRDRELAAPRPGGADSDGP